MDNFQKQDRRSYTLIAPCKRSAARGYGCHPHPTQNSVGVQPATGLSGWEFSSNPELRFACTGLFTFISLGDSYPKSIQIVK